MPKSIGIKFTVYADYLRAIAAAISGTKPTGNHGTLLNRSAEIRVSGTDLHFEDNISSKSTRSLIPIHRICLYVSGKASFR